MFVGSKAPWSSRSSTTPQHGEYPWSWTTLDLACVTPRSAAWGAIQLSSLTVPLGLPTIQHRNANSGAAPASSANMPGEPCPGGAPAEAWAEPVVVEWHHHRPVAAQFAEQSSTTSGVIGTANRSRACATTPRSSQCDRPSGCVEMMISSAPNVRSASSIACSGLASPTSPEASMPSERSRSRLASSRCCAATRALSSSDAQNRSRELRAGVQTRIRFEVAAPFLDHAPKRLSPDRLVRDHEDPTSSAVRSGASEADVRPGARPTRGRCPP